MDIATAICYKRAKTCGGWACGRSSGVADPATYGLRNVVCAMWFTHCGLRTVAHEMATLERKEGTACWFKFATTTSIKPSRR